ncbi:S-formylglutathione hydrolase FrmB [Arthrobacter sp. 49Tsu3.1M3]|uniref:alpha/beta hydrolase n=1 Tax=Arthrobacter sp. 49Tsu3.1M3 TaxID=1279029 RepID=UPI0009A5BD55|nr:alpha/beta hydrolase-fold protein [Arthrobacter sp. 49Tsu3.1M3]SKB92384.1 S-formylglutathione hydrolase FrmB [Arthrobacter sp. 49Tsu3.1M3]
MDYLDGLSLVDGPVVWLVWASAAAGLAYLLWHVALRHTGLARTGLAHAGRREPGAAVAVAATVTLLAAALVAAVHWFLLYAVTVFPAELPGETLAWSVAGVVALLLWLMRLLGLWGRGRTGTISTGTDSTGTSPTGTTPSRPHRLRSSAAATAAFLAVLALSAVQINIYFGLNHTVGDLTGAAAARIEPLEAGLTRAAGAPAATGLTHWQAPAHLPDGVIRKAVIPGTVSGFQSRDAYVYLPPAYLGSPRPALPVLVLFSGQPGGPADWLTGGALRSRLDRFAAEHAGVAPVTVVVDPNGSASGNTLCMDSRIAQADTFLAQDVPDWIKRTLDVDPDPRQWAAGGFSFGGTCAIQMVTRHPDVYSAALAFSSEEEPALAKVRAKTIEASFGADAGAFDQLTPLRVMAEHRFDGHGVYFAAGDRDPQFTGYMDVLSEAARRAGFSVETHRIANAGHSWDVASGGLPGGLDFLARRWGIAP